MATELLVSALLFAALVAEIAGQCVNINISTTDVVAVVDDHFVGITLDVSILPPAVKLEGLDFSSPKVQLLAKAISPTYLRIGGTLGDHITFDPTGHGSNDDNLTFTGDTWDKLNIFAKTVGWDVVMGLNVLKRKGLNWDPTNAKELLSYTIARNYSLAGLELGNEPQFFPGLPRGAISGGQLGMDFMTLKNIIRSTPALNSTLLIGADSQGLTGGNSKVFREFFYGIGSLAVERITIHQYYDYEGRATIAKCLDPGVMDALPALIDIVYNVTKESNPDTPVWLGETSSYWGGGAAGISDRYVAGFLWLDKLGVAAEKGLKVVMRQSFYGLNYSLIEKYTFDPYPDYWLTLLYKRLVGHKVLNVTTDGGSFLRVYAHCTNNKSPYGFPPGSVTVFYLNIHNDTPATLVNLPQFQDKVMLIYSLTPASGNLTDRYVALNDKKLEMVNNTTLPVLEPVKRTGGFVTTRANTFGFIVIPDADVDICKL